LPASLAAGSTEHTDRSDVETTRGHNRQTTLKGRDAGRIFTAFALSAASEKQASSFLILNLLKNGGYDIIMTTGTGSE
jgi:hypothetical protein